MMMMLARSILFAGLVALAALTPALTGAADAQRGRSEGERSTGPERDDHTKSVALTPENGVRIGNADARVKVVAYMSMACPECAEFVERSDERLFLGLVRRGVVSVEYRPFVSNGFDLAATMVARCASPRLYFDLTHALLGNQPRWMGRMQGLSEAQRNELRGLPQLAAMQRLATWLELDQIAARNGLPAAQLRTCLADQAGLDRIAALQTGAQALGVTRAPSFIVNGQLTDAHDWPALERLIRAAQ
jgi:protein-disulfide isomerase